MVTKAAEPAVARVEGETGETPSEEDTTDNEGKETKAKLASAPQEYEENWLPLPMGENREIEENDAVVEVKSSFSTIGEEEEDGQDEGIDTNIEEVSHFVEP